MKNTIYIFSNGILKRKDNTLFLELENGQKNFIPIENTKEIIIFGEVDINKRFLEFVSQTEIILHFFNYYNYYCGSFYPREHYNSGYMILKQAEFYLDIKKRLNLAKQFVFGSIENILKILKYYNRRSKDLANNINIISEYKNKINNIISVSELMAIEGNIRKNYYSIFDIIINSENINFDKRTKRPPKNEINALISFGNSLIYVYCLSEIYQTHLDPRIGFLHSTNFRRFTLNLDIAEIFKPIIVDRTIFNLFNKNRIKSSDFEKYLNGLILNDNGKKLFINEIENKLKTTIKHHTLNKEVSYRTLIRMELYKLEKHLLGESEYFPFVMDW
jgi:CRISPR-associated protein Cas1